jgi:hypothetical protein
LRRRAALLWLVAGVAESQEPPPFTGYYQNVPLWSGSNALVPGGVSDFNRFRISTEPAIGDFSFELAYEQVLTLRENEGRGLLLGTVPSGGEWIELQWTLEESEHVLWQHRFDRLRVGWAPTTSFRIDAGRQAVSWATTLFLTPSDPFSPFNPADPFREFRAGVDAVRIRVYPGPLSELDVVVRPTKTAVGEELTALGRGLATIRGWELSGWAGVLYDDAAGAFGVSGSLGPWALRGEGSLREQDDGLAFRGSIGLDRRFTVSGTDLFLVLEYQRDGFGAAGEEDYARVLDSKPFLRGELQVLGRDEAAIQTSYQLHPLWSIAGLVLWNLDEGSALLSPSFAYSASDSAAVSGGLFFGFGASDVASPGDLPSEYGLVPVTAYVSVSLFF